MACDGRDAAHMTQLLIPVLPVAAPGVRAKRNRETFLERMMEADLDVPYGEFNTGEMTAWAMAGDPAIERLGWDLAFRKVAMGLRELERRGALSNSREACIVDGRPVGFWSTLEARGRPRHRRRSGRML